MNSAVAILVPVLARPGHVAPLLASIQAATPEEHQVLFIVDPDDEAERAAIAAAAATELVVPGRYAQKINAAARATSTSLIFTAADDLHFHPGWLPAAASLLDEQVQVVGVNDLCNPRTIRGEHATHFLITRAYARRPTIDGQPGPLSEAYAHNAVDDELIGTARHRRAYAFAADSIVEHRHPMNGTAPDDDTYRKGRATLRRDVRLLRRRQRLWTTV